VGPEPDDLLGGEIGIAEPAQAADIIAVDAVGAEPDDLLGAEAAIAVGAKRGDEIGRHAMVAKPGELGGRDVANAVAGQGSDEVRSDSVVAELDQSLGGQARIAELEQLADEVGSDPVIAEPDDFVGRNVANVVAGEPGDIIGADAVVAHLDQGSEPADPVAVASHAAQIIESDAVIAGAGEVGRRRRLVTLPPELVDIIEADIVHRHRELLLAGRPADAALGELGGEARIGGEAAIAGAPAAADDALAVEGAGVAGHSEADRSAGAGELALLEPGERGDRDVAADRPVIAAGAPADLELDLAGAVRILDLPVDGAGRLRLGGARRGAGRAGDEEQGGKVEGQAHAGLPGGFDRRCKERARSPAQGLPSPGGARRSNLDIFRVRIRTGGALRRKASARPAEREITACRSRGFSPLSAAMTEQPRPALSIESAAKATVVADLMSPPVGLFRADMTVAETVEQLRDLTREAFITYGYVTDEAGKLEGVLVMRDLLLADPETRLESIMLRDPFALGVTMPLADALKAALSRHYPVYPVCDADCVLKGLIRGEELFAEQAIEISAQAGQMVGVEKEERLATPLLRSLKLRHPWLQINLLTAFVAAAVVGVFEATLAQLVILAVFLPVMAGQTGNTGCQALAVTLRGMTLGELRPDFVGKLIAKEGVLGLCNGVLVGITAGAGMVFYAMQQGEAQPWLMGMVVAFAMTVSCAVAGIAGAIIPLTLKRLGADPATASSIFLTTASDVASMGVFLTLATMLLV